VDFLAQAVFLNWPVEAETLLMPRQLLHALQAIERAFGSRKLVARPSRHRSRYFILRRERDPPRKKWNPASAHGQRRFVLVPLTSLRRGYIIRPWRHDCRK